MPNCKRCINKDSDCYRCHSENNWEFYKEKEQKRGSFRKKNSKKEGMSFQRKVVNAYNKSAEVAIDKTKAYEQPNSGAIWHMPGDVVTEEVLMECKERGSVSSSGEKQITIRKDWLEKAAEEAFFQNKPMLLPFGFKNDDQIYMIGNFNLFLELVQIIDLLKVRVKQLEAQLKEGD